MANINIAVPKRDLSAPSTEYLVNCWSLRGATISNGTKAPSMFPFDKACGKAGIGMPTGSAPHAWIIHAPVRDGVRNLSPYLSMFNFKFLKFFLLFLFAVPASLIILFYLFQSINTPNIQDFKILNEIDISLENSLESKNLDNGNTNDNISFQYKLIGYRAGGIDASVIVKKSNKEYVVSIGEKLEGVYELMEVNQEEIIFRDGNNLYKIENLVGK